MPICSQAHMVMRTETHVQTHTEFTHTAPGGWEGRIPDTGVGSCGRFLTLLSSGCPGLPP